MGDCVVDCRWCEEVVTVVVVGLPEKGHPRGSSTTET